MRRRALAGLAAVAVFAAVIATAPAASAAVRPSNNYAGYIAVPKSSTAAVQSFKDAQADFTVPQLNCSANSNASVYHFAGLGGFSQQDLDAAGIEEYCQNGAANYDAAIWYYDYYSDQENSDVSVFGVNPGDAISASIYENQKTGNMVFAVADQTTGRYYQQSMGGEGEYCCGDYTSAEVVSYGNINNEGTADFGSIKFTGAQVIGVGSKKSRLPLEDRTYWMTKEVEQSGPVTHKPDIQPGPISTSGGASSFTNTWLRTN